MISTLVIDLDGPLLDGMQRHYRCYRRILEENGFEPIPIEQYWEMKRNRIDRKKMLELSGATSFYDAFLENWMRRIETREYLAFDCLQNNVASVLHKWKELGVQLCLATMRNNRENLLWQLDELDLRRYFDEMVVVGSEKGSKKKASAIRPKLKETDTARIIWIGDTEVDVDAARELSVRVCALTCGLRTREYLMSFSPDFVEENLCTFAETMNRDYMAPTAI